MGSPAEIAPGFSRLCTDVADFDRQPNHYLVGLKVKFPAVRDTVVRLIDPPTRAMFTGATLKPTTTEPAPVRGATLASPGSQSAAVIDNNNSPS